MAGNHGGASRPWRWALIVLAPLALGGTAFAVTSSGESPDSRSPEATTAEHESTSTSSTTTTAPAPPSTAAPASAADPTPEPSGGSTPAPAVAPATPQMMLLVCESEIIVNPDGTETSSKVVTKVPVGTPVPDGCYIG